MSRQVSPTELARIIAGLLVTPERVGELTEARPFTDFFTAAAELVTNFCGGEVRNDASSIEDDDGKPVWFVGVHANCDLPDPVSNIWSLADPEGVEEHDQGGQPLDEAFEAQARAERDLLPAARALLPTSPQAYIETMWTLSTTHLSKAELTALDQRHATTFELRVSEMGEHGWLIDVEGSADAKAAEWPFLVPILTQAREWGVAWVRFDANGPVSPQLPLIARAD